MKVVHFASNKESESPKPSLNSSFLILKITKQRASSYESNQSESTMGNFLGGSTLYYKLKYDSYVIQGIRMFLGKNGRRCSNYDMEK